MKKKILILVIAAGVVVSGVAVLSAWEAHVINVTAHIENALKVLPSTGELVFGTVFPQEHLEKSVWVTTSTSFCEGSQRRVLNIDYRIVQKPKCINQAGEYALIDYATHQCPDGYEEMSSLCPYLSKTPKKIDPAPYTDYGVSAFHDPEDASAVAKGTINKDVDLSDEWIIDLAVPCFEGYCGQDYGDFVRSHNPQADPRDYEAVGDPKGTDFGCDLWFEVTDIY